MGLADEIDREMQEALYSLPIALEVMMSGEPQQFSADELVQRVIMPILDTHRLIILRLAGEIEKLAGGSDDS